jgi:hypothetical protein
MLAKLSHQYIFSVIISIGLRGSLLIYPWLQDAIQVYDILKYPHEEDYFYTQWSGYGYNLMWLMRFSVISRGKEGANDNPIRCKTIIIRKMRLLSS